MQIIIVWVIIIYVWDADYYDLDDNLCLRANYFNLGYIKNYYFFYSFCNIQIFLKVILFNLVNYVVHLIILTERKERNVFNIFGTRKTENIIKHIRTNTKT